MGVLPRNPPSDSVLDPGIAYAVRVLQQAGISTFESCEGESGHCFPEPTVRFHGTNSDGLRAVAAALTGGLPVSALRRYWDLIDNELTGPHWEMTFAPSVRALRD